MPNELRPLNLFADPLPRPSPKDGEKVPHADLEQLRDYHRQRLSEQESERLRSHLAQCSDCADRLAKLEDFFGQMPPDASPEEIIERWQHFQATLSPSLPRPTPPAAESDVEEEAPRWRRAPKGFVSRRTLIKVATSLTLLVIISTGFALYDWWQARLARQDLDAAEERVSRLWNDLQSLEREHQMLKASHAEQLAALNERVKRLTGPHLNWPVFEIYPREVLSRLGSSMNEVTLASSVDGFSLILNVENQTRYPEYRLEIVDAENTIIWQGSGLQRNALNAFTLALTRDLLPGDHYTLKIYGKRGSRLVLLEVYPLRIRQRPATAPSPSTRH